MNYENNEPVGFGHGEMTFCGDLNLTGRFSGRVHLNGTLTIGSGAKFTGEIDVTNLVLYGEMAGLANVLSKAVLYNGSSLSGRLITKEAEIHDKSKISGKCQIVLTNKNPINSDTDDSEKESPYSGLSKQPIFLI